MLLLLSHWIVSDSLWPHGLQHTWLPCPSLSTGLCSNSCPLSQWCYLTIFVAPFYFCLQSFPASESFPVIRPSPLGGHNIGALASVLSMSIQGWFYVRVDWFDLALQFSSVAQSCLTLCEPMNCSVPGLLVHHQLLEFTQTHVHRVGDAIQPSHPLSSPSPPAPNPSKGLSKVFSSTIIWKHQFFGAQLSFFSLSQPSLCSNSHNCTWLLEKQ